MNESFFRNPFDIESIAGCRQEDEVQSNTSSHTNSDENKESATGNNGSGSMRKDR